MDLQNTIETYRYAAILIGTFLEGETILVLAGLAAHQGYLMLTGVILAAFFGSLCGDQLFFIWDANTVRQFYSDGRPGSRKRKRQQSTPLFCCFFVIRQCFWQIFFNIGDSRLRSRVCG